MARTVSLYEAKTHLSSLVEAAATGEEIVIAKNGKAKARLVPLPLEPVVKRKRRLGFWEGQVWGAPGWEGPLPDDVIDEMLHGDDDQFAMPIPSGAPDETPPR